ncbi:hypothetical protein H6G76_03350 [Nostoc sp. FACHB-152]|uniref:hypothetical protein n=1 Tax=unclassified Nostoc TaxID=2593658 RepID=UPI001687AA0A|nr:MULTISPECIES: hypothetical protein [unclassified Nostoc]MBD2446207.1 hypothetical protein [Nostoc sp. FACHB-152]MBD2469477.1 hypothetical protein [Nostoc sp. FACHB-145]
MSLQIYELKETATQLLAAMLSNPHLYPQVSDEGGYGQIEQQLIIASVEMAESLIKHIENAHPQGETEMNSPKE